MKNFLVFFASLTIPLAKTDHECAAVLCSACDPAAPDFDDCYAAEVIVQPCQTREDCLPFETVCFELLCLDGVCEKFAAHEGERCSCDDLEQVCRGA